MTDLGWVAQPQVFPWLALGVGLCVGSFLNVVIHRLPRMMEREWREQAHEVLAPRTDERFNWRSKREKKNRALLRGRRDQQSNLAERRGTYNLIVPRSTCPSCGHTISAIENIPLLSYIALGGRCSNCGTGISVRYPLVELLAGAGASYAAWHFGWSLAMVGASIFIWATIALAFIDQATGYLYDDITLPLLWAGLLLNLFGTFAPLAEAVIGAAAGYLMLWIVNAGFRALRGIDGMGNGDFKMNAAVGAFVGSKSMLMVILLSSFVGLVFGCAQMLAARRGWDWKFRFHFGPYIAIAGIATLLWGEQLAQRYPWLRLF